MNIGTQADDVGLELHNQVVLILVGLVGYAAYMPLGKLITDMVFV